MFKWSEWDKKRKITVNNRCGGCGKLIHWRRIKSGLCRSCSGKNNCREKASNWRGGRVITTGGYVRLITNKEQHRSYKVGNSYYVQEHIFIWEKANNKLLPDGYVIHHLNGIKTDNRPENLTAIMPKNHGGWTYVQSLQKRIKELEIIISSS